MPPDQLPAGRQRLIWRAERAFGLKDTIASKRPGAAALQPALKDVDTAPDAPAARVDDLALRGAAPPLFADAQDIDTSAAPDALSESPFDSPVLSTAQKRIQLDVMNDTEVRDCQKCGLSRTRTNTVFGEGDVDAGVFFIGEGPGETEDQTGRPFVGRAGQLLDKMIAGMGLRRDQVFIGNIVKCRPPENRVPAPDEVDTCTPYLVRQLEIIRPKVIVTLGLPSAKYMLKTRSSMGQLRGRWHDWRGIRLMPTFHPAYLLRAYTPENRRAVWDDLKKVMSVLGLADAPRQ
jgi:DNA polymerase